DPTDRCDHPVEASCVLGVRESDRDGPRGLCLGPLERDLMDHDHSLADAAYSASRLIGAPRVPSNGRSDVLRILRFSPARALEGSLAERKLPWVTTVLFGND